MNQLTVTQAFTNRGQPAFESRFEQQFGAKIRHKLNLSNAELDTSVGDRLLKARQQALSRHTEMHSHLSVAGMALRLFRLSENYWQPLAAAAALIAFLVGGDYVTSIQRAAELEEVDSALLADDLPINAYLDRGFDTWLNSSAQR
jgi:hypothetical protein